MPKEILLGVFCVVLCSCTTSPPNATGFSIAHDFAGVIRGKPGKHLVLPALDRPQHVLGLIDTAGVYEADESSQFLAGAVVRTVETWDFVGGSGIERGFMVFTVGSDELVGSYEGHVSPAERGRSALTGKITFEGGSGVFERIKGNASYSGIADQNSYELRIAGRYRQ